MTSNATIIGAGPAGCSAAIALGKLGWDVTLIEQHRFPRDKVCGESLSALGIGVLRRLGVASEITALKPKQITHTALHATDGHSVTIPLPQPMWGISRGAMDLALLSAAAKSGANILQPARCESLNGALTIRHLNDNRLETRHPSWVLLADGKGALLPHRPMPTTDFGVKAHFASVDAPADTVALFGVKGHYVGLAPIEGNLFNIAMSVPAARIAAFNGFDALWQKLLTENAQLAARFSRARRVSDWLASPLPRFAVARSWPSRIIPLGNAAAALEPIGGEGMGLAMHSAELAAQALHQAHQTNTLHPIQKLRARFNRLWQTRRLACRALAMFISRPNLASPLLDWAGSSASLPRAALAWMGKD